MKKNVSTIRLTRENIKELVLMRDPGEDYNAVVTRLIVFFKKGQPVEAKIRL